MPSFEGAFACHDGNLGANKGSWACFLAHPVWLSCGRPKFALSKGRAIRLTERANGQILYLRQSSVASRAHIPVALIGPCHTSGSFRGQLGRMGRELESSAAVSMWKAGLVGVVECLSLSRLAIDATSPG